MDKWFKKGMASGEPVNDDDLIDFIIKEEGFLSKPANIGDGMTTLGSGLTDPRWLNLYRQNGNRWSEEDNRRAVAAEVAQRRRRLEATVPNWDKLGPNAQKALISYNYNYNFTPRNSPRLFQAMQEGRYRDALLEMNATSRNPKFLRGLAARRQREQAWGLQDYPLVLASSAASNMSSPQVQGYQVPVYQPVTAPEPPKYKPVAVGAEDTHIPDTLEQYNQLMSLLSQSQAPTGVSLSYSSGGQMKKRRWDDLSMKERADLIGIAVRSGITSLDTIRDTYNQYAEGGDVWEGTPNRELPPSVLLRRMEAKRKAAQPVPGTFGGGSFSTGTGGRFKVGENTFPFAKDQNEAYDLAVAHKMKEFTFNNKRYNTKQENNPIRERNNRLAGQLRIRDEKADSVYDHIPYFFGSMEENTPMITDRNFKAEGGGIHIDPSKKGTFTAAASKHGKSVQAFASQVLAHPENYSPAMRKKANFARNAAKWHGLGGSLFDDGGYVPSPDGAHWVSNQPITPTPQQYAFAKRVGSWLPYVGTAIDVYDAVQEPTLENIAWAGTSVGLDLLSLGLLSRAKKGVRTAKEALEEGLEKAAKAETKFRKADKAYRRFPSSAKRNNNRWNAWEEWDRANSAVRDGIEPAFSGVLRRNLFDAEQNAAKAKWAPGFGGTLVQGLQNQWNDPSSQSTKALGGPLVERVMTFVEFDKDKHPRLFLGW